MRSQAQRDKSTDGQTRQVGMRETDAQTGKEWGNVSDIQVDRWTRRSLGTLVRVERNTTYHAQSLVGSNGQREMHKGTSIQVDRWTKIHLGKGLEFNATLPTMHRANGTLADGQSETHKGTSIQTDKLTEDTSFGETLKEYKMRRRTCLRSNMCLTFSYFRNVFLPISFLLQKVMILTLQVQSLYSEKCTRN